MKKLLLILSFSFCFPSFANDQIKSLEDGFCYQANTAQIRNNRYFLPNESKPFSGENLCIYAKNGQYHSKGELIDGLQNYHLYRHYKGQLCHVYSFCFYVYQVISIIRLHVFSNLFY